MAVPARRCMPTMHRCGLADVAAVFTASLGSRSGQRSSLRCDVTWDKKGLYLKQCMRRIYPHFSSSFGLWLSRRVNYKIWRRVMRSSRSEMFVCLIFCVLATSQVLSGRAPTGHSARSFRFYHATPLGNQAVISHSVTLS